MVWPDGRRFEGQWKNGKQHGEGLFTNADGQMQKGKWVDGNPVCWFDKNGQLIMTTSSSIAGHAPS